MDGSVSGDGAAGALVLDRRVRADRDFWLARLPRRRPASGLPLDLPRPAVLHLETGAVEVDLGRALADRLGELTRGSDFLLYTTLVGGVAVLLHRLTGVGSISIGSPARCAPGDRGAPNALPIVVQLNESLRFRDVLMRVRGALLEAYDHQACPVGRLVRELGQGGASNRNPFFEVAVRLAEIHGPLAAPPPDAFLDLAREGGTVRGVLRYGTRLFRPDMMRWRVRQLLALLVAAIADADRLVGSLPLEPEEADGRGGGTAMAAVRAVGASLDAAVAEVAARAPQAPAVLSDGGVTTYAALVARAERVAAALRRLGIVAGDRVAVFVESEPALVAAILGVLGAGGTYVPIHPAYHREGIAEIVGDAGARHVVTEERLRARLDGLELEALALDGMPAGGSGPAGGPRPHAASTCLLYARDQHGRLSRTEFADAVVARQLGARHGLAPLTPDDRVLQLTPYPFYPAIWELFGPLSAGASVVLAAPDARRGGAALLAALRSWEATAVQLTPSLLRSLVAEPGLEECTRLRLVYTTGEPLPAHLARALTRRTRATLINVYGACGALGDVAAFVCDGLEEAGTVPLGRLLAGRSLAVLDAQRRPAPVGTPGRLHVTAGSAGEDAAGAPKSDDVVRLQPDGTLEYVGRAGQAAEWRGAGVDPAVVEAVLAEQASVRQAVVMQREDPETHRPALVAYVVPAAGAHVSREALREAVAARYDAAYVPSLVLAVPSLPLRLSGKLDPGALPTREDEPSRRSAAYVAPATPAEAAVAARWEAVLGFGPIGGADDFFALRGSSLQAIEIISLLSEHFDVDLPMDVLFAAPTVAKMAAVIEQSPRRHAAVSGDGR